MFSDTSSFFCVILYERRRSYERRIYKATEGESRLFFGSITLSYLSRDEHRFTV